MTIKTPKSEKLNFTTKLAFGAGDLGPAIAANILIFYLLFFFTNVAGLRPGLAGSILMIGKISDAINDPIIGMLSDRTRSRWGRRLPWMLGAAIPFAILYFLQWIVPHFSDNNNINTWGLFIYYIFIAIFFNITYTMVNLPYSALTPELTQDYDERTNLNSFRFSFSIGGSILSLILAGLIFSASPAPEDGWRNFLVLGATCSILAFISILWCALRVQERGKIAVLKSKQKQILGKILLLLGCGLVLFGISSFWLPEVPNYLGILTLIISVLILLFGFTLTDSQTEPHLIDAEAIKERQLADNEPSLPFQEQLKIVFQNRPFLFVIGIYLCSWLAVQLTASILIYYVVSYMELTEETFPSVALAVQGTALMMLFVWKSVSERLGKKAVYFMGTSLWFIAQSGLFFLQPTQVTLMYGVAILAGFGVSVAYLIPWSMVPDVIEFDELETGQRREGVYYAFMVLLQKFGLALGLFLVGIALEAAGFIERIPGEPIPVQPNSALWAIRLAVGPLPAIFLIMGVILAYFYPITKELHAEIRLKLLERLHNVNSG